MVKLAVLAGGPRFMPFADFCGITTPTVAISSCSVCHWIRSWEEIYIISSYPPALFVPTESVPLKSSSSVEDTGLGRAFQREDQSLPDCLTKDFLLFPKQKVHNFLYLQDIIHTIESVTILSCFIENNILSSFSHSSLFFMWILTSLFQSTVAFWVYWKWLGFAFIHRFSDQEPSI